jgi:hypothetical protein
MSWRGVTTSFGQFSLDSRAAVNQFARIDRAKLPHPPSMLNGAVGADADVEIRLTD